MKEILLSGGKGAALVDDDDFESLSKWRWHLVKRGGGRLYAARLEWLGGKQKTTLMHRQILPGHLEIDHKNGDGLDNRRANIRPCTRSQNMANRRMPTTRPYRGVQPKGNRFRAAVFCDKKFHYLGSFESAVDAAVAYDTAALRLHGEFAVLNF